MREFLVECRGVSRRFKADHVTWSEDYVWLATKDPEGGKVVAVFPRDNVLGVWDVDAEAKS